VASRSYIQIDGKLIPKDEYYRPAAQQGEIIMKAGVEEPFRSPVDGSLITSRRVLEEHNRRNNVVNVEEFSSVPSEYFEQKRKEHLEVPMSPAVRRERLRDTIDAFHREQDKMRR